MDFRTTFESSRPDLGQAPFHSGPNVLRRKATIRSKREGRWCTSPRKASKVPTCGKLDCLPTGGWVCQRVCQKKKRACGLDTFYWVILIVERGSWKNSLWNNPVHSWVGCHPPKKPWTTRIIFIAQLTQLFGMDDWASVANSENLGPIFFPPKIISAWRIDFVSIRNLQNVEVRLLVIVA